MFDAINLEEALSDIFDVGVTDDNLALLYKANKEIKMAVKTEYGLTERQTIGDVILQGDILEAFWPQCKQIIFVKLLSLLDGVKYKDEVDISILALVDDLIGVTKPGYKAQQMNVIINAKTAEKRLLFGDSKCKTMVIADLEAVMNNNLLVDKWKIERKDEEDLVETYVGKTIIKETEKQKYFGYFLSNKGDNMTNVKEMQKKSENI